MERLVELVQRRAAERAQRFVGREMEVLVEGPSRTDPSRLRGRTRHNKTVNFDGVAGARRAGRRRDHRCDLDDAGRVVGEADPRCEGTSRYSGRRGSGRPGWRSSWPSCCGERGEDPVAISCDALQVYEGLGALTGVATPQRARAARAPAGRFRAGHASRSRSATTCASPTPRSTRRWRRGGGRWSSGGRGSTCARRSPSSPWSGSRRAPRTPSCGRRRPATRRASSASTWSGRCSTRGSTPAPRRSSPPAPRRGGAPGRGGRAVATARKALGFDELLGGDLERMKKRSRNYARRQLTWMRKIPNLRLDRPHRPRGRRGRRRDPRRHRRRVTFSMPIGLTITRRPNRLRR